MEMGQTESKEVMSNVSDKVVTIRVKTPAYGNYVMVAYEGEDVGPIYISDVYTNLIFSELMHANANKNNMIILKHGSIMFIDRSEEFINSMQHGCIRYFSDINRFNNNPPLKVYKMTYVF